MKNKSPFTLFTFLFVCCISLSGYSQQQNNNSAFSFKILEFSDKPDASKEHFYLLSLTNHSNKVANYILSDEAIKCETDDNRTSNNSNLIIEIYNENLNKRVKKISLTPHESIRIKVKAIHKNNVEIGTWNCTKVIAKLTNGNEIKEESVVFNLFIPDLNIKGQ